ncbi:hypothetical protein BDV40DRAFT_295078 [Aspergillus tamarii]|uniref:Uncharacterized protein n=1 Tax=Aspergillus tamarii TaxID=41984 RepID=A0A5N6VB23_ASPTM|nr:hypothetical protein BDV40DRAFT_295078 [Aspergillus tamarii]
MPQALLAIRIAPCMATEGHRSWVVSRSWFLPPRQTAYLFSTPMTRPTNGTASYSLYWSTSHCPADCGTPDSGPEKSVRTPYPEALFEELIDGETSSIRSHAMVEFGLYWNLRDPPRICRSSIGRPAVSRPSLDAQKPCYKAGSVFLCAES